MRVGSVFTGIGGFDLGFEQAGYKVAWQIEKDAACGAVLARHWPDVPRYGDVQEVTGDRLRADLGGRATVDVLVGGFPCTDISVAGNRSGLAGPASILFYQFTRLAAELRPAWLLIENVDGLLSSQSGRDMGAVVGTLADLGYGFAWRVLDARFFGLAQRRRRLFIVGHLGEPWSAPAAVLLESDGSPGDPHPSHPARPVDAADVVESPEGARRQAPWKRDVESTTSTLTASMLGGGGPELKQAEAGFLIPAPSPETFSIYPESGQGADLVARETDTAPALTATGISRVTDRGTFVTQESYSVYPETGQGADLVVREDPDLSPALTATNTVGYDRGIFVAATFRKSRRIHHDEDYETWVDDGVANTLNTFESTAVRTTHAVVVADSVRRLSPMECERLQGFPDRWTEGCYDTQRYKQLGNACPVPVIRWIANRLRDVA